MKPYSFKGIKLRWLFAWLFLSFVLLVILEFRNNLSSNLTILVIYLTVFFWLVISFYKHRIDVKQILVSTDEGKIEWGSFLILKLLTIGMTVSIPLVFIYIFALIDENFVAGLIQDSSRDTPGTPVKGTSILLPIFLAPIVEELFFRGYLLNKWGEKVGVKKAVIFTSLLFAILHFNPTIPVIFLDGVLYSLIYVKTQRLYIPILLHALHNSVAAFLNYGLALFEGSTQNPGALDIHTAMQVLEYLAAAGLFVTILLLSAFIVIFRKVFKKEDLTLPFQTAVNLEKGASAEG